MFPLKKIDVLSIIFLFSHLTHSVNQKKKIFQYMILWSIFFFFQSSRHYIGKIIFHRNVKNIYITRIKFIWYIPSDTIHGYVPCSNIFWAWSYALRVNIFYLWVYSVFFTAVYEKDLEKKVRVPKKKKDPLVEDEILSPVFFR